MEKLTRKIVGVLGIGMIIAANSFAAPAYQNNFEKGAGEWTADSGKVARTGSEGGKLLLFSQKVDPEYIQGVGSCTVSNLEKNTDYVVTARFRFEKDFRDEWPWSSLEVWTPDSKWNDGPEKRIAIRKVASKKSVNNGAWQNVELRFNSGDNTSVILRIKNNPKMLDQTHWDDFVVDKENASS